MARTTAGTGVLGMPGVSGGTASGLRSVAQPTPSVSSTDVRNRGLLPGGRRIDGPDFGYTLSIPNTSNLSRSDLDKTDLVIKEVFWPSEYVTAALPFMVQVLRTDDTGDTVSVVVTERLQGLTHMNTATNQKLTRGTIKQYRRLVHFEGFATEVQEMETPALYRTFTDMSRPEFVDEMNRIWGQAHSRILQVLELFTRRAMWSELPTIWNLSTQPNVCARLMRDTFMVCNRLPQDYLPAILGSINAALISARFDPAEIGNVLLVPRQAFINKFAQAGAEVRSLNEHEALDKYTLLTPYRIPELGVVTTATSATATLRIANTNIVPYDHIPPENQELNDMFTAERIFGASIVVPIGTCAVTVRTPQGTRTLTTVDLAFSAEIYDETGGDTIGETWAFHCHGGPRALSKWILSIIRALKLTTANELKDTLQRNTGVSTFDDVIGADIKHLTDAVSITSRPSSAVSIGSSPAAMEEKMFVILANMPGTREVLTYLHSISPFNFCNFTLNILGSATFSDAYLIHPAPMAMIMSDSIIGRLKDPNHFGPDFWRILTRLCVFYHSNKPNIRIPDVYADNIAFSLRKLGTTKNVDRTDREINGRVGVDDAIAIFCGVDAVLPPWCEDGTDSKTRLPQESEVKDLFHKNSTHAAVMLDKLRDGKWLMTDEDRQRDLIDASREFGPEGWVPWPANLVMEDGRVQVLQGYDQLCDAPRKLP